MKNKLNPKHKVFCDFFLSNGENGTKAAISAGYKAHSSHAAANRLLKIPEVKKYLEEEREKLRLKLNWTKETAYEKLKDLINIVNLENRMERGDYIKALQELNKLFGNYEPEKSEININQFKFKMNFNDNDENQDID